jgi:hypothetical protein
MAVPYIEPFHFVIDGLITPGHSFKIGLNLPLMNNLLRKAGVLLQDQECILSIQCQITIPFFEKCQKLSLDYFIGID